MRPAGTIATPLPRPEPSAPINTLPMTTALAAQNQAPSGTEAHGRFAQRGSRPECPIPNVPCAEFHFCIKLQNPYLV